MQSEEQEGFAEQNVKPSIYSSTRSELQDDTLGINSHESYGKLLGEINIKEEQPDFYGEIDALKQCFQETIKQEEKVIEPVEREIDIPSGRNEFEIVFPEEFGDLMSTVKEEEEEEEKHFSNDDITTYRGSIVKDEIEVKYDISDNISEQAPSKTVFLSNQLGLLESNSSEQKKNFYKKDAGSAKHKSKLCDQILDEMCDIQHHMATCTGALFFECENCNKILSRERISEDHTNTAVNRSRKSEDSDCKEKLLNQKHFQFGIDKVLSPFSKCSIPVPELSTMTKHTRKYVKQFNCDRCNTKFRHSCNLSQHKKTQCEKFSCEICNEKYSNLSYLSEHMNAHSGKKPFSCSICNIKFSESFNLTCHLRTHHGEKQFSCSICNKKFSKSCNLFSHMRIHTEEKPFSCSICDKTFTQSYHLTYHMRTHTAEKPFSCSICNKKFSKSSTLSIHMRIHTGEKPFSCSICNKKFTQSCGLTYHMRIHTGEKPFSCCICNKYFASTSTLTYHMRIHT